MESKVDGKKPAAPKGGATGFGNLAALWNGIQAETVSMREAGKTAKVAPSRRDTQTEWRLMIQALRASRLDDGPGVEEYVFLDDNIFRDRSNPFEEGVRITESGGNLFVAALAFEAACQKDPTHIDAWVHLGETQAQNERDDAAIRALGHTLTLDPDNASALMGLALSYINEGDDSTASRMLERWLSVKHPAVAVDSITPQKLRNQITRRRLHHEPDLQAVLGVLFYSVGRYSEAIERLRAALRLTEVGVNNDQRQVHLLWNHLGAALVNSGQLEDAVSAYEKALSTRPNFARARYNLSISCMSARRYDDAARHLLAALDVRRSTYEILGADFSDEQIDAIKAKSQNPALHDMLRRVFYLMGRRDLAGKVVAGVDLDIFRDDFEC